MPTASLRSKSGSNGEQFVRKRVASLKPSPENLLLYAHLDPDDPEIVKLANSIKKNGCVPLVVTLDNYIVSGHRRHLALTLNEQEFVRCQVLQLRRDAMTEDEFVKLLREHNHQRHKSVAEQVREELVDIDPAQAHENLRQRRARSICAPEYNGVETLVIEGEKRRYAISEDKAEHVKYIHQIVFEHLRDYWPLSVRGVHYQLLNFDFVRGYYWPKREDPDHGTRRELRYRNDDGSYKATSELITRLRLNGDIPWRAFDDPTRPLTLFHPFENVREFVRKEVEKMLDGYWRDLLQTQPNHVEVLCEKNTIYQMVLRVTRRYQIPTSSGRGFNSIDPWHDLYRRYRDSGKRRLIVIVLSDYDPEGEMIPQVGGRTLRDDFGVEHFEIIKAGVTREQIEEYSLPPQNFAKETSSNHQWFVDRNGGDDTVYELEALDPPAMLADLENVIKNVIDIDLFNREAAAEQDEAAYLEAARRTVREALNGLVE
jgi:hypothetical protein